MAPRLVRRVQRKDRVVKRGARAPKTAIQPRHLPRAVPDHASLGTQTYLTVEELTAYLRFPSCGATRNWISRTGLPKCRRGGRTLLVLRRDVDRAVQPGNQLGNRHGS